MSNWSGGGGGALSGIFRSAAEAIDPLAPQASSAPTAIADANLFMRIRKSPFSPCHVQSPAIPTRGILVLFLRKLPAATPAACVGILLPDGDPRTQSEQC